MADYSPMMKQYFEVKEKYPNTILFFASEISMKCFSTMRRPYRASWS